MNAKRHNSIAIKEFVHAVASLRLCHDHTAIMLCVASV